MTVEDTMRRFKPMVVPTTITPEESRMLGRMLNQIPLEGMRRIESKQRLSFTPFAKNTVPTRWPSR
jgi:hypothetical protein